VNEYFFTTNFHIFTTGGEFSVVKKVKIGGKKCIMQGEKTERVVRAEGNTNERGREERTSERARKCVCACACVSVHVRVREKMRKGRNLRKGIG
jgi:hypothetical protein